MRGDLVLGVADLHHHPGARRHERVVTRVGQLADVGVAGAHIAPTGDVDVDVILEAVSDGILVSGSVRATWEAECRRCLAPAAGPAQADIRELFEARPAEGESWPLRHEQVDLEPLVREALLLALPLAPLCRESCAGLCSVCGADLNEGPCSCVPEDRDPRWAALDALHPSTENSE